MTGIRPPSISIRSNIKALSLPPLVGNPRRVMLVTPPGTLEDSYGRMAAAAGELPLLGLAFIAGSLRHQGHEVRIFDYGTLGVGYDQFQRDFQTFQPHVLGMTGYITNMKRCARLAELSKQLCPDTLSTGTGFLNSVFNGKHHAGKMVAINSNTKSWGIAPNPVGKGKSLRTHPPKRFCHSGK